MQLPSASNTAGTVLGGLAGALVSSQALSWPFVTALAMATGITPVGIASVLALGATSLVNLGVSHVAEIKNLNDLVSTWWPQIEHTYPPDKLTGTTTGNLD
jgi:hypothetical protein